MTKLVLLTFVLSVVWSLSAQDKVLAIRDNLLQEGNNSVLVVSHCADWRNAPENSLQAIRNCIEMGVDMVEIDLKKTKDGHLILMHDETIDRTTTGKGRLENFTIEDARKKAKINQTELAKRIGSNKGYISRVENGQTKPKISTFYRIMGPLIERVIPY